MNNLIVKDFFDTDTSTMSYVVYDSQTKDAIVIDTVLDYDPLVSKFHTSSVEKIISFIKNEALKLHLILETHAHADHLTASQEVKKVFPDAQIAIGERIREVQESFRDVYNLKNFNINGIQFDRLFEDNEKVEAGSLSFQVIFTPGHTPACVSYFFENFALFTGDALFMPDMGTGRCDFPKGSAEDLYHSVMNRLYKLPDDTKIFVGHDYQPGGRELAFCTTIGEQKERNIQLNGESTRDEFVSFRKNRDKSLKAPRLLLPSLQVNIDAGKIPDHEDNGKSYLKIPISPKKAP